jgi:outer membrane PBP1 activator LpoA protein
MAPDAAEAALRAEQAGEYVVAAREFDRLARIAPVPQRQHFQLKSVEVLIKGAHIKEAREKIAAIRLTGLDAVFTARKQVLEAQIAGAEGLPQQAIRLLNQAEKTPQLDPTLLAEIYWLRAQTELTWGNPMNAVKNLIGREKFIVAKPDIAKNQQQLWQVLTSLNRTTLQKQLTATKDATLAGWLELAIITQENGSNINKLTIAVDNWKKSYPQHPVSEALLAGLTTIPPGMIGYVKKIALLLPLTSDYAQAAEAVRTGFLAMSTANLDPDKPEIKVYDIGADPSQAPNSYAAAVNDGAQLIIGPLGLEAIDQVVKRTNLAVPTILLGHTDADINAGDRAVFQFGLSPEQEARQVAERAYLDGHRRSAVLYSNNASGQRMLNAFSDHWQRLGGTLLTAQSYTLGENDYSESVKRLLNIPQGEARKQALDAKFRTKLKFEPRPRADIDCIFLVADAKHARLIKPQFNYHRASDIPIYSTSHIFSGKGEPIADVDLDGVMFGDMPWMLASDGKISGLRKSLQADWPYAHSPLDRLYALGIDVYAVIPQLNRLSSENAVRFRGVTGGLSLEHGRLQRQLLWAKFRRGVPQLLDTSLNYKGQFEIERDSRTGGTSQPRP